MKAVFYPTLSEVLELHSRLIELFGGASGVRDLGLLESALMRPRTGYYATLSLQAAALLQSLAQNHPFVDGNKRVAFATTTIFLRANGYRIKVEAHRGESFVVKILIGKKANLDVIAKWLEEHMSSV